MRVKKKDLRKRLPQLPINYPGPVIEEPFNYDREANRVENLCRRLADNEVETRDACLNEVPRFIRDVCSRSEFVTLAQQKSLPKDFSYEKLADFLSSNDNASRVISKKASNSNDKEYRALFSQPLRDLALIFDKLTLGLFYNLWHSDKPNVQHECALRIAMLSHVPPSIILKLLLWRSLWRALAAKWCIVDHHRLDKYMAYVRKLVFQMLRDICTITVQEAAPLPYDRRSGAILSSQEIVDDAMRLVGDKQKLQLYMNVKSVFDHKMARHRELKKQRREEHEAKMAEKAARGRKGAKKALPAEEDAKNDMAPAGKKKEDDKTKDQPSSKAEKENSKKKASSSIKEVTAAPAAAIFLTAFSDMVRTEIFQSNTSVGLAMHLADVCLDELRREFSLHKYPSIILAFLFAVPFRAMASGDVLQIERRVQLMIVQPIAGGVFERFFVELLANAGADTKKPARKGPSLKSGGRTEDEDDFEAADMELRDEFEDEDDEFNDTDRRALASHDAALGQQQQQKSNEVPQEVIDKSVNLAEAVAITLENIGLDPRTKFLMRPLFEEASRTVKAYVLHRRKPTEYALLTPAEKRKMLLDAVNKKVFTKKGDADESSSTKLSKKDLKKKLLAIKRKQMKGEKKGAKSTSGKEKKKYVSTKDSVNEKDLERVAASVLNAKTSKATDPKQMKLLQKKKQQLVQKLKEGKDSTVSGQSKKKTNVDKKLAVKSRRRRLHGKKRA